MLEFECNEKLLIMQIFTQCYGSCSFSAGGFDDGKY
jgi:hypothetical protein